MNCLNPLVCKLSNSINIDSVVKKKNKQINIIGNLRDVLQIKKLYDFKELIKRDPDIFLIPCRKCVSCKKNRSMEFTQRAKIELKKSDNNLMSVFLTLTYDDEHIIYSNDLYPTLSSEHITLFLKRLRKSQSIFNDKQVRYLVCGEYGSKSLRPHYHLILFNIIIPNPVFLKKSGSFDLFTSDYISNLWPYGFNSFSFANENTIKYVTNYSIKANDNFDKIKNLVDIEKPFLHCSQNFGFDFDEFKRQFNNQNNLISFKFNDNVYYSIPFEYYRKKIKNDLKNCKNEDLKKFYVDYKILDNSFIKCNNNFDESSLKTLINQDAIRNNKIKKRSDL